MAFDETTLGALTPGGKLGRLATEESSLKAFDKADAIVGALQRIAVDSGEPADPSEIAEKTLEKRHALMSAVSHRLARN